MKTFAQFLSEAWKNGIETTSKEVSVTSDNKYNHPKDFKRDSIKVGNIGPLEIHSDKTNSGLTHFTWSPSDRKIHHVVHAAQAEKQSNGNTRLKFLSAHGRKESPVRMGDVYRHLVKHHNIEFEGTGHSEGAQKMWKKFHDDPELQIHGYDSTTGEHKLLSKNDKHYAERNSKDPEEKKIGRMSLILSKK